MALVAISLNASVAFFIIALRVSRNPTGGNLVAVEKHYDLYVLVIETQSQSLRHTRVYIFSPRHEDNMAISSGPHFCHRYRALAIFLTVILCSPPQYMANFIERSFLSP